MIVAFRNLRKEHAQINSRLEGSISGIRLTRAFSNERFEVINLRMIMMFILTHIAMLSCAWNCKCDEPILYSIYEW